MQLAFSSYMEEETCLNATTVPVTLQQALCSGGKLPNTCFLDAMGWERWEAKMEPDPSSNT